MKKQPNNIFDSLSRFFFVKLTYVDDCLAHINKIYAMLINLEHPIAKLLRLDKPAPFLLVVLPAWWAAALLSANILSFCFFAIYFLLGAVIMRSAGCIINDIIDKDIDPLVERTKNRPLANGSLSVKQALCILGALLTMALIMLLLLPKAAIIIGIASIIPIIIYPFLKRYTYFPQVALGFVFNIGALIAWATVHGSLSWPALLIYTAAIIWTIGYDTIYAYQDIQDDIKCGVKSTALKFGENGKAIIWRLYQFSIMLLCLAGLNMHMNLLFYFMVAISAYHLHWQIETVDIRDPASCTAKFKSNLQFGLLVLLGIMLGRL